MLDLFCLQSRDVRLTSLQTIVENFQVEVIVTTGAAKERVDTGQYVLL